MWHPNIAIKSLMQMLMIRNTLTPFPSKQWTYRICQLPFPSVRLSVCSLCCEDSVSSTCGHSVVSSPDPSRGGARASEGSGNETSHSVVEHFKVLLMQHGTM